MRIPYIAVFFFVTIHELCHSLVAKRFGIPVREIMLLPIGGVSKMEKAPEKPREELLISLAGPLSNVAIVAVFYFPLKHLLGAGVLLHPLSTNSWPLAIAYAYWINLMLAGFNMLPAFPMDGGRVLRALLATRIGYYKATRVAVALGRLFAIALAFFGIIQAHLIMILIAIFIFMAASNEQFQADIKETLKKNMVRDILLKIRR